MEWHWETQKKIWEKRVGKGQVVQPNGTSWDKLESWDKWNKKKGVFRSSWDKWDKDKGSVHLNHSTCPKWDYKAVEFSTRLFFNEGMVASQNVVLIL